MALKIGEQLMGKTRHSYTITLNGVYGTITPETLPSTEPADYTFTYTVSANDFPTVDGAGCVTGNTILIVCAGQSLAGTSQAVSYRVLKNEISVSTGSTTITAGNKYALFFKSSSLATIAVNDVIKVRLWAADPTYFNYSARGYTITPLKINIVADTGGAVSNFKIDAVTNAYAFTGWTAWGSNDWAAISLSPTSSQYLSNTAGVVYGQVFRYSTNDFAGQVLNVSYTTTTGIAPNATNWYQDTNKFISSASWDA